jgi:hypothetical protein
MRDPARPADHPLLELVEDVRAALSVSEDDTNRRQPIILAGAVTALHSARRLIETLELIVDELSDRRTNLTESSSEGGLQSDFQHIDVRVRDDE